MFTRAKAELTRAMETSVATGRDTAFAEIVNIHKNATLYVAEAQGIPMALLGAVTRPALTLAGTWEALGKGAQTWQTLIRGYGNKAVDEAQRIVTTALVQGMSPDELAKRLRPYVQGAEPFRKAFKGAKSEITNAMLNDPRFEQDAMKLRYNADRIAFSEIENARSEAEIQAFASDPFVKGVRWTLSENRGTQESPDACDVLADTDYYGMGKGVYPVTKVPARPHPFCRCIAEPVSRPSSEMHLPKPNPSLKSEFVGAPA
jgi:hypothetical protein